MTNDEYDAICRDLRNMEENVRHYREEAENLSAQLARRTALLQRVLAWEDGAEKGDEFLWQIAAAIRLELDEHVEGPVSLTLTPCGHSDGYVCAACDPELFGADE